MSADHCSHDLEQRAGLGAGDVSSVVCLRCGRLWELAEVMERDGVWGRRLPDGLFVPYDEERSL